MATPTSTPGSDRIPAPPLPTAAGGAGGKVRSRARAHALLALQEALTLAAVLVMIAVVAAAFAVPWVPSPPAGGAWIARYAPIRDGHARLSQRTDADGNTAGWIA